MRRRELPAPPLRQLGEASLVALPSKIRRPLCAGSPLTSSVLGVSATGGALNSTAWSALRGGAASDLGWIDWDTP